jgi:hypothetical protein
MSNALVLLVDSHGERLIRAGRSSDEMSSCCSSEYQAVSPGRLIGCRMWREIPIFLEIGPICWLWVPHFAIKSNDLVSFATPFYKGPEYQA